MLTIWNVNSAKPSGRCRVRATVLEGRIPVTARLRFGELMRGGLAILAVMCGTVLVATAQAPPLDLLLRNGRIIDGTGNPWFRADIALRGDTIALNAPAITEPATRTVDLKGQVVTPGFIDIHSHARRGIFDVPTADNYIRQG